MKKKEIFLVIVLVLMGFIHLAIKKGIFVSGFIDKISDKKIALTEPDFPNKYSGEEKTFKDIRTVTLENAGGSIVISSSDSEDVYLTTELTVYSKDTDKAEQIQKAVSLFEEINDGNLYLSSYKASNLPLDMVRVKYILKVPDSVSVELSNYLGDVIIHSTGAKINSDNSKGNTTVSGCDDTDISVANKKGEIIVQDVKGRVYIYGWHSPVLAKDITGELDIKLHQSEMDCSDISAYTLSTNAVFSPVNMSNISAQLATIVSKKGDITMGFTDKMQKLSIRVNNSDVHLKCPANIMPDLNADIKSGDITIKGFSQFTVEKGKTRTIGVISGEDTAITIEGKYGDIQIERKKTSRSDLPVEKY